MKAKVCCNCWEGTDPPGCQQQTCGPSSNPTNCCGCFNSRSLHCCSPYDSHLPAGHGGVCKVEDWPRVQTGFFRGQGYHDVFKSQCPDAYAWQFDDLQSTYQCKDSDYIITWCGANQGPVPRDQPVPKAVPKAVPKNQPVPVPVPVQRPQENPSICNARTCKIDSNPVLVCIEPGCFVCKSSSGGCATYFPGLI